MALTLFKTAFIRLERRTVPSVTRGATATATATATASAAKPSAQYNFFLIITKHPITEGFTEYLPEGIRALIQSTDETATEFRHLLNVSEAGSLLSYIRDHSGQISYDAALLLTTQLAEQLGKIQESTRKVAPFLLPNAIGYVINSRNGSDMPTPMFMFLAPEGLAPMITETSGELAYIPEPSNRGFYAPEIQTITTTTPLPAKFPTTSWLYSLVQLVTFSLSKMPDLKTTEEIKKALEPLEMTKLGFALSRCLDKNPADRVFLII